MTSSFKDQTENIPPSSSDGSTEAKAQPSKPSANSENMPTSTQTINQSSKPTKRAERIDDKVLQHAEIARVALNQLELNGLIRRYRVLSEDRKTVKKVILVFDNTYWTPELELKQLSYGTDSTKE